ncbi:MAG: hypothetical protein WC442_00425 [Candidatus Omnitrophota bacterium]
MEKIKKQLEEIKSLLEAQEKRISNIEEQIKGVESTKKEELCQQSVIKRKMVDKGVMSEIFDVEGDAVTVVSLVGNDEQEKTQNAALLVLYGYKYFKNQIEVSAQEIRRNLIENNISINNSATHLKEITPSLIRRKGVVKSPKTSYKLTLVGEGRVKNLIAGFTKSNV